MKRYFPVIIIGLSFIYLLYACNEQGTENKEVSFSKEVKKREEAAIARLKDIRKAQEAFYTIHSDESRYVKDYIRYAANFDQLIDFVKTDSFIIRYYTLNGEWDQDMMSMKQAIQKGILIENIHKKSVLDSLFEKDYPVEELRYVPFTGDKIEFELSASRIKTRSGVEIDVFEAYVDYSDLLMGLDQKRVEKYKAQQRKSTKSDGLKVGDIHHPNNNAGNWE